MKLFLALAKRQRFWALCATLLLGGLVHAAPAVVVTIGTVNELPPNLGYEYPLHSAPTAALFPATTITSNTSTVPTAELNDAGIGWNGTGGYRVQFESLFPQVSGLSLPGSSMPKDVGSTYQVFQTSVDGVGFILAGKAYMNLDLPADGTSGFVTVEPAVRPSLAIHHLEGSSCLGGSTRFSCIGTNRVELTARVALVKIPRTNLDPLTAPAGIQGGSIQIGNFVVQKSVNGLIGSAPRANEIRVPVFINFSMELKPLTCAVLPGQTDQTILLPVRTIAQMDAAMGGRIEPPQTPAVFNLQCQAPSYASPITVFATLSDLIAPANNNGTNTVLGIETGASRATGMGIELMRGASSTVATPLAPSSRQKGALGQWQLTPYGSNTDLTLRARYVKTGPITPGIVRSRAAITFSYQ